MAEPSEQISYVTGTIEFADGSQVEFILNQDGTTSRWGAPHDRLGAAVGPCEAMQDALRDKDYYSPDPEPKEEE